jgi:hypothetical protein
MANITEYWDVIMGHYNAVSVNAGLPSDTVADVVGYFMATNGNNNPVCGSQSRVNLNRPGTVTIDLLPGAREFVSWDSTNQFPFEPPGGISLTKIGYVWKDSLDTLVGFSLYKDQIDSGLPPIVVFNYWNPRSTGIWWVEPLSGDTIYLYTQDTSITNSSENGPDNPDESWPCAKDPQDCPENELTGHAVTGVGYAEQYDPDGMGPLPLTNWIICHDNWTSTKAHVMIDWTAWQALVTFNPGTPPYIIQVADLNVREGDTLVFKPSAVDNENDSVFFSYSLPDGSPLPAWITLRNDSLVFVPTNSDSDTTVRIIADDGYNGKDTFDLRVIIEYNLPPVITNTVDSLMVQAGDSIAWSVHATDGNGDSLVFVFEQLDGSALPGWISVQDDSTLDINPTITDAGLTIRIIADDGWGGLDSFNLRIIVDIPTGSELSGTRFFSFSIKGRGAVFSGHLTDVYKVEIVGLPGRIIKTLRPESHRIVWDRRDTQDRPAGNGIYFLRIVSAEKILIRKFVLIY